MAYPVPVVNGHDLKTFQFPADFAVTPPLNAHRAAHVANVTSNYNLLVKYGRPDVALADVFIYQPNVMDSSTALQQATGAHGTEWATLVNAYSASAGPSDGRAVMAAAGCVGPDGKPFLPPQPIPGEIGGPVFGKK